MYGVFICSLVLVSSFLKLWFFGDKLMGFMNGGFSMGVLCLGLKLYGVSGLFEYLGGGRLLLNF